MIRFLLPMLLAGVAGYLDAMSYVTLHLFVAAMTGTMVLTGLAFARHQYVLAFSHGGVMLCFLGGVLSARWLRRLFRRQAAPSLLLAGAVVAGTLLVWPGKGASFLLAYAMGCEDGAVAHFSGILVNTAFITGDMEQLGEALTAAGLKTKAALMAGTVACYGAGAAVGGSLHDVLAQPLLPAIGGLVLAALLSLAKRPA